MRSSGVGRWAKRIRRKRARFIIDSHKKGLRASAKIVRQFENAATSEFRVRLEALDTVHPRPRTVVRGHNLLNLLENNIIENN